MDDPRFKVETVRVKAPEGGDFVVINADEFDPKVHAEWVEPPASRAKGGK